MPEGFREQVDEVLGAFHIRKAPVDPFCIAEQEGIELAPGMYGARFDARIEYLQEVDTFVIYYKGEEAGRTAGRVRFSIAHELGHYYIPKHRKALVAGAVHSSETNFRSRDQREVEADEFAAELLMPTAIFAQEVESQLHGVCNLKNLCRLAEETFRTSLTSTARRYCDHDIEPCTVVLSDEGRVKWAVHSYSMKRRGMGFIKFSVPVPAPSKTASLWEGRVPTEDLGIVDGLVDAQVWYESGSGDLWEEAMPLGYTGLVLTFLTVARTD